VWDLFTQERGYRHELVPWGWYEGVEYMVGGSRYRDRGVIYVERKEDIHSIALFPSNTTLTFMNRCVPSDSVIRLQVWATISEME
jgi:hypothetical protein